MTLIKPPASALLGVLLLWCSAAPAQTGPQPRLPTIKLTAGIHVINTELPIAPAQQMTGYSCARRMAARWPVGVSPS